MNNPPEMYRGQQPPQESNGTNPLDKLEDGPYKVGPLSESFSQEEMEFLRARVAKASSGEGETIPGGGAFIVEEIVHSLYRGTLQTGFYRPYSLLARWCKELGISPEIAKASLIKEIEAGFDDQD